MSDTIWSRALDLLDRRGWRKGDGGYLHQLQMWGSNRSLCITEALCVAEIQECQAQAPVVRGKWSESLNQALGLTNGIGYTYIINWNDAPERTFAQVENLLTELHEKELAERGLLHETG